MKTARVAYWRVLAVGMALALTAGPAPLRAQQQPTAESAIHLGKSDLGGTVTSPHGPEAGVWVIAQTDDLPTKYAKVVVTDDQGRYLIPDLPDATYTVWVRGYGLVNSAKTQTKPGKMLDLKAVPAPDPAAAAQYYPALYWYSLLTIPDKSLFPGTGPKAKGGNGMPVGMKSQGAWLDLIKTDTCESCHQLGDKATRTLEPALGHFDTAAEAWGRRIQSGQASSLMINGIGRLDTARALGLFGDWTDRIAKGELPFDKPARPQGVERNIVITMWDWASPTTYLHNSISTDKRNPTLNAYGKIYASPEESTDASPTLDPVTNTVGTLKLEPRDPKTPSTAQDPMFSPSPYWGTQVIWNSQTNSHNAMLDQSGNIWFTSRIRPPADPSFCQAGSDQPSAKLFPLKTSGRQLEFYDPKTQKITTIDTCFGTHHLQFGFDADNTLWTSGGFGGDVVGWLDVKKFLATGDEKASQGWTAFILDTAGTGSRLDASGKMIPYVEPNQPVEPGKDKRISAAFYGVSPDPSAKDNSAWGSIDGYPGGIARIVPGSNPPMTTIAEYYEVPADNPKAPVHGYSPRGMDIDSQGVVWSSLASGHLASFDRRKCQGPLNGPTATGEQCPEGWTLYQLPGPQFKGVTEPGSADSTYYTWVDQHDTLGLGKDVPIATGNDSDSLLALVNGKFVTIRFPYPMGFFAKNVDGRIDDANAGWKGRGLWATDGTRAPFHMEEGKGEKPKVYHVQLRPNPLAD